MKLYKIFNLILLEENNNTFQKIDLMADKQLFSNL